MRITIDGRLAALSLGVALGLASTFARADADDAAPPALELGAEQVKALHVTTAALATATVDRPVEGYAQVLDAGTLLALLDDAHAADAVAQESAQEAARLQGLARNDDVSRKALGAARAQAAADRAKSDTLVARVALEWSPALAHADAALVADLRRGVRRLLRLEFGDDVPAFDASAHVGVTPLSGSRAASPLKLLGAANGATSTLTGPAWLAVGVLPDRHPGERLRASLDAGAASGVLVPDDAIVSASGKRWAYLRGDDGQFVRRALPDDARSVRGGALVQSGFSAGENVVVSGAAQLLGVERKPAGGADAGEED